MLPNVRELIRTRGIEKAPGEGHNTNILYSDKNLLRISGNANAPSFSHLIPIDVETFGNAGLTFFRFSSAGRLSYSIIFGR
jgi:hypothetical protein